MRNWSRRDSGRESVSVSGGSAVGARLRGGAGRAGVGDGFREWARTELKFSEGVGDRPAARQTVTAQRATAGTLKAVTSRRALFVLFNDV